MNYQKLHDQIIFDVRNNRLEKDFENHHIISKSLGGSNKSDNIVKLTYRQHWLVHYLLIKITTGDAKRKMCWALHRMTFNRHDRHSKKYEITRRIHKIQMSAFQTQRWANMPSDERVRIGRKTSSTRKRLKIVPYNKGKKGLYSHSSSSKKKLSKAAKGKPWSRGTKKSLQKRFEENLNRDTLIYNRLLNGESHASIRVEFGFSLSQTYRIFHRMKQYFNT